MKKHIIFLIIILIISTSCKKDESYKDSIVKKIDSKDSDAFLSAGQKTISGTSLLKNLNARKAISLSIDKVYICDLILGGSFIPANYYIPKKFAYYKGEDFRVKFPDGWNKYNPVKAREYWELAKSELEFNNVSLEFLTYKDDLSITVSNFIKGQLESNLKGLSVLVKAEHFSKKLKSSSKGEFNIEMSSWLPDYPDPMTFLDLWVSDEPRNTIKYNNAYYDKLIRESKKASFNSSLQNRWENLRECEKILIENDTMLVPLFQFGSTFLIKRKIKNINFHNFGAGETFMNAIFRKGEMTDSENKKIIRLRALSSLNTMDHNYAKDEVAFTILSNTLEGLIKLDENDEAVPAISHSWDVSDDGKKFTFYLKKSYWSNGEKVTAYDFVDSWRRLASPLEKSEYNFILETAQIKNASKVINGELPLEKLGIKALSENKLMVELEENLPYFLKILSLPHFFPLNKKFLDKHGDNFGKTVESTLYNGPYVLSYWDNADYYKISKNPNYHSSNLVKNDGVIFKNIGSEQSSIEQYKNNELDIIPLSGENVDRFREHPDFMERHNVSMFFLTFNISD